MHLASIGIGSNLGDRRANIETAIDLLRRASGIRRVDVSSLHETEPVGGPPGQEMYLNAAAQVETELEPAALLGLLLRIERELGRERPQPSAPRTLDLDLLLFDELVIDGPSLIVPHPRMHQRRFVLEPLAEIAGDVRHPVLNCTVQELLDGLAAP